YVARLCDNCLHERCYSSAPLEPRNPARLSQGAKLSNYLLASFQRQLLVCVMVLLVSAAWAQSTKVIYGFAGDEDGESTGTDLVLDSAGNMSGTTVLGGDFGSGTVFMLSPNGSSGWTHTVLYSFTSGPDGGQPYKGVTLDAQGNLYGTAVTGGSGSCEG